MIYLNEIDPFTAAWCREQFEGEVDERDIRRIDEPSRATRQHYFAGLGGWEHALRLAGWPADLPVWTGSCPCQPFSAAGKGRAHEDERDLWPAFFRLISIGKPAVVFGEQVAGAIAYGWLDRICDDLEGIGYAVGATVLPASSVGAPHIRQRLYWVAIAQRDGRRADLTGREAQERASIGRGGEAGGMAESELARWTTTGARPEIDAGDEPEQGRSGMDNSAGARCNGAGQGTEAEAWNQTRLRGFESRRATGGLGDTDQPGQQGRGDAGERAGQRPAWAASQAGRMVDTKSSEFRGQSSTGTGLGPWSASQNILCSDGKWRRIPLEPGFQPLADDGRFGNPRIDPNLSSRIGALKASGNSIVVPLAAEFIKAVMDVLY